MKKYQFLGREFSTAYISAPCPRAWATPDLLKLAALPEISIITTKSVTLESREGNEKPREYYWGKNSLNAVGLANDGIDAHLGYVKKAQTKTEKPFIMSLAGFAVSDYATLAEKANENKDLLAIELNLSCPNTEKDLFINDPKAVSHVIKEVRKVSQHKIGVKVNPESDGEKIRELMEIFVEEKVDFIVCCNTVGGGFMVDENGQSAIVANGGYGGLGGAQVQAVSLATLRKYHQIGQELNYKGEFVGLGGVFNDADAEQYIATGANMVGMATKLMIRPK